MSRMGVFIGSSPLDIEGLEPCGQTATPWGEASGVPVRQKFGRHELIYLSRHGAQHQFAPHQINYRANVWVMHSIGVDCLVGTYTVGGIDPKLGVGQLVIPHQLIDYTWGRESTYDDQVRHVEFAEPYDRGLIAQLAAADDTVYNGGVYAATQGPRLETVAEVRRLAQDGATVVGMTGMPEAALARELEIPFAGLCLVVNPAAGVSDEEITLDAIYAASRAGAKDMLALLQRLLSAAG